MSMSREGALGRLAPVLGAALVALGLLTVAIRTQVVSRARGVFVAELRVISLERRERDLQARLQQAWMQVGRQAGEGAVQEGQRP
jgi:hypothetical protein